MALLRRKDVAPSVALRERIVAVEALGGDVLLRGMYADEMLVMDLARNVFDGAEAVPFVLSRCVLDADREPLMTREEWRLFRDRYVMADLVNQIRALSVPEDVEKKAPSGTTSSELPMPSAAPSESSAVG